jgi:hypothetical protein
VVGFYTTDINVLLKYYPPLEVGLKSPAIVKASPQGKRSEPHLKTDHQLHLGHHLKKFSRRMV